MYPVSCVSSMSRGLIRSWSDLPQNDEISEKFVHLPLEHLPRGRFFDTIEDGIRGVPS